MGKLSGEFREPNRKDKVTRFRSRLLGLLINTLGGTLKRIGPRLKSSKIRVFHWILSKYKISTGFVTLPNVIFHVPFKEVLRPFGGLFNLILFKKKKTRSVSSSLD